MPKLRRGGLRLGRNTKRSARPNGIQKINDVPRKKQNAHLVNVALNNALRFSTRNGPKTETNWPETDAPMNTALPQTDRPQFRGNRIRAFAPKPVLTPQEK